MAFEDGLLLHAQSKRSEKHPLIKGTSFDVPAWRLLKARRAKLTQATIQADTGPALARAPCQTGKRRVPHKRTQKRARVKLTRGPCQADTGPRVKLTRGPCQADTGPRVKLTRATRQATCPLDTGSVNRAQTTCRRPLPLQVGTPWL